jgi:hypothetical protein
MELIDLESDSDSSSPFIPVSITVDPHPSNVSEVESWLFEHLAECLEWLFNSDHPLRSEEIDFILSHKIESGVEEKNDSDIAAADCQVDCDEEHWLNSLENNSELNHQVAIEEVSTQQQTIAAVS